MKNKKAATLNSGTVLALFLFGFLAILFFGGLGKLWDIISVLKQIPSWILAILGIWVLIMFVKKK